MMTEEFKSRLVEELIPFSIKPEEDKIARLYKYYELLIEWNKQINLTAITEQPEVITKHFVDSLSIIKIIKDINKKQYQIIDIGTGAGFPGIPLKIVFPQLKITLVDSLNKRVKFLKEVINNLELQNIDAIHGRAEDLAHDPGYREHYDLCVSRAVANLSTLAEYCMPFIKDNGYFISYKSIKGMEELTNAKHAIYLLNGKLAAIENFLLNGTDVERYLIKIKKVRALPNKYPRKAGLPAKEPLK